MPNFRNLFFAIATAVMPLAAADINGNWKFDGNVQGNPVKLDCAFKQDGEKFTGTCKSVGFGDVMFDGTIVGEKIQFSYKIEYQGSPYTLFYTGVVKDDAEMKGTIDVANIDGVWTAKKDSAVEKQ
jgi:hypothetical protein